MLLFPIESNFLYIHTLHVASTENIVQTLTTICGSNLNNSENECQSTSRGCYNQNEENEILKSFWFVLWFQLKLLTCFMRLINFIAPANKICIFLRSAKLCIVIMQFKPLIEVSIWLVKPVHSSQIITMNYSVSSVAIARIREQLRQSKYGHEGSSNQDWRREEGGKQEMRERKVACTSTDEALAFGNWITL